ncbi:MAG: peptidase [Wigfec virus K19_56]|nr:MAG: peptidase [Wigfec virus K19_56]
MSDIKKQGAKPPRGGFVYEPEATFPGDVIVHEEYKAARAALVNREMCGSRKYQEQQWRALRLGAHPDIILFTRYFCAKLKKIGIPVFASEIVRTPQRQRQLYEQGFSKAVGAKAPHPYGCAVDLVHSVHGWNLSQKQWEFFGVLGKELAIQRGIAITWGGDWPPLKEKVGWDPAHWQLKHWRQEMTGFPFLPHNRHGAIV